MKKRILPLLMFIILFIICTNIVEADSSCQNSTDKIVDGHCCPEGYTAKVIEKGNSYFCLNADYSDTDLKDFKFESGSGFTGSVYQQMQAEVKYGTCYSQCDGKLYYGCNAGSGVAGGMQKCNFNARKGTGTTEQKGCFLCQSSGTTIWGEMPTSDCRSGWEYQANTQKKNCKFDCTTEEECSKVNWLAKCEYKELVTKTGKEPEIVTIFFNNNLMKMFVNGNDFNINSGLISEIGPEITKKKLLNEYNKRKAGESGCPEHIYYRDIRTVGQGGSNAYYTLSPSNVELENEKYDDKIYELQEERKSNNDGKDINVNNCAQLIGEPAQKLINTIMKWIRISVPILLIALGIVDFTTAVFSSKEEDMKKKRETFIKRIIAAILVFLAPIFVNLLLNIANDVWSWINPDTCLK